jgi:hypothetical protein
VPDTLLPSLVAEVRREQGRRRRWLTGLAAAAAVVVIGLAAAFTVSRDNPAVEPPLASEPMVQIHQNTVEASVALTSVPWGTRLDLTCSYETPPEGYQHQPPTYALVVRTADGNTERVATWKGLPGKTMNLTGATALTTEQIASVEVQDAAGHALLELNG